MKKIELKLYELFEFKRLYNLFQYFAVQVKDQQHLFALD